MTSQPDSVRMNHARTRRRLFLAGAAGASWLLCGGILVALTRSFWAWGFVSVGALTAIVFFGLLPRLRSSKAQLQRMQELQDEQHRVALAQQAARLRAFNQPPIRAPFPSR